MIETKIALELTQKLVENQLNIVEKNQREVLSDANSYSLELTESIEGLQKLITAIKTADFVIVAQP